MTKDGTYWKLTKGQTLIQHVTIPTAYISLIKTYYKETNKRFAKL